jgi:hypothetical protein
MTVRALLLAGLLSALSVPAWAGADEEALTAYRRGDYAAALQLWRPMAAQGDATAEFWVGACYDLGHGTAANLGLAVRWYRQAAEQGLAVAQHNLARIYELSEGLADYSGPAAATWYRRAADQGFRPSQLNLGVLYFTGRGVKPDLVQAYKWFALAGSDANRDHVAGRMSSDQRAEAEALVRAWQIKPEP